MKDIFLKAKELIEKDGWIQGSLGNPGSGYCMFGAIFYAQDPKVRTSEIARFAGINGYSSCWNDDPSRTKEEVIEALQELADKC